MNVKEIVRKWLQENGYTGLYGDDCGCEIADLMPCDSEDAINCKAGYKVKCTKDCEHDFDYKEGNWHVQADKEAR